LKRDRVVFKQGSIGDKMYLVVDGEVSINLKNEAFISLKREIQILAG
jgi:CRP-like cAMP-binding protein